MTDDGPEKPFEVVLDAALAGQGWAFTSLFTWLEGPIAAFVRGRGCPEPDEVVNEVFLGAFRGLHRFEGDQVDFRRWIFGIARNKIVDAFRAKGRRDFIDLRPNDELPAGTGDTEADALAEMGSDRVTELLSSLTEEQRDVIVLRLISDLSIAEVAAMLDKQPGAVKALQARALRRLGRVISAEAVTP